MGIKEKDTQFKGRLSSKIKIKKHLTKILFLYILHRVLLRF